MHENKRMECKELGVCLHKLAMKKNPDLCVFVFFVYICVCVYVCVRDRDRESEREKVCVYGDL